MALKDLLVHLDASTESDVRLDFAAALAQDHDAHLTGLYTIEAPSSLAFAVADPSGGTDVAIVEEMITRLHSLALEDAKAVETKFQERLRRDGLQGEWRLFEGIAAETTALHARYADLTIVGQADPEQPLSGNAGIAQEVMLGSGRPLLIIPYNAKFGALGKCVLVGWKPSREAARAVNDAIPIIEKADNVTILAINPRAGIGGDGDLPAADIALHLARHGIEAQAAHTVATDVAEADILLNQASDMGADLVVIGGYGHSRTREFVFGGVTRDLLREMTVPILISH
jgi:nucleotide-binding universal stress UspA family protein